MNLSIAFGYCSSICHEGLTFDCLLGVLQGINNFCREIGITRTGGELPLHILDFHVRADLHLTSPRTLAVLRPLKLVIINLPEDHYEMVDAKVLFSQQPCCLHLQQPSLPALLHSNVMICICRATRQWCYVHEPCYITSDVCTCCGAEQQCGVLFTALPSADDRQWMPCSCCILTRLFFWPYFTAVLPNYAEFRSCKHTSTYQNEKKPQAGGFFFSRTSTHALQP